MLDGTVDNWVYCTQMLPTAAERPKDGSGALSGPLAGFSFIASLVALNALSKSRYPTPGADPSQIRRYYMREHGPARIGATLQLLCAVALGRFARAVAAMAARAGRDSDHLRAASIAGGSLAAGSLATSALATITLTTRFGEEDTSADALYRFMFLTGGPVHGVGLGALVGSLGLAGRRTGELSDRLSNAALASGVAGALSPLALVAKPAIAFIPLGRLSALAVIGTAGVRIARAGDR
jgi:hypothetical protein